MKPSALEALILAQREFDVEVSPGKFFRLRRYPQATPLISTASPLELITGAAVGWRGITEADILGASVGVAQDQEFSPEVAKLVLTDNIDWLMACANAMVEHINARAESTKAIAGNFAPS